MLTDTALKRLKEKGKPYKVTDRDGMYVLISKAGTISFKYDYHFNGRRETINFGKYGRDGISLELDREKCLDAKKLIKDGISPALENAACEKKTARSKEFRRFCPDLDGKVQHDPKRTCYAEIYLCSGIEAVMATSPAGWNHS